MKKYLSILLLLVFIAPFTALASWWNPLSWFNDWSFNKKEINSQIQVDTQKTSEEKINELQKQLDELKNKQVVPSYPESIPEVKKEIPVVDNSAKTKTETPAEASTTVIAPISSSEKVALLKIVNVKNKVVGSNVTITWETNLPTESTVTIIESVEKVYSSKNGLSTNHSVTIYDLIPKNEYNLKLSAKTEDKKQTDTYYGYFFVIEKFIANLGEYDEDKCQTIILIDSNGRLKNKQVHVELSRVSEIITSYGSIKLTTNSDGEIKYCDKPSVNQYRIEYLDHTVTLKR